MIETATAIWTTRETARDVPNSPTGSRCMTVTGHAITQSDDRFLAGGPAIAWIPVEAQALFDASGQSRRFAFSMPAVEPLSGAIALTVESVDDGFAITASARLQQATAVGENDHDEITLEIAPDHELAIVVSARAADDSCWLRAELLISNLPVL